MVPKGRQRQQQQQQAAAAAAAAAVAAAAAAAAGPGPNKAARGSLVRGSSASLPRLLPMSPMPMMPPPNFLSDNLDQILAPGDVLSCRSTGHMMGFGGAGGFMGHVFVVKQIPHGMCAGSMEAVLLYAAWPKGARELWRVPTVESTRQEHGLHHTDTLLYVDPGTRRVFMVGELQGNELGVCEEHIPVEVWQSPAELRATMRPDLMAQVLEEMDSEANWSYTTAARAFVQSQGPQVAHLQDADELMRVVKACWNSPPICTSVVVEFWQRYLCKLSDSIGAPDPADLIRDWMPLLSDRVLPDLLVRTMQQVGWIRRPWMPAAMAASRSGLAGGSPLSPFLPGGPGFLFPNNLMAGPQVFGPPPSPQSQQQQQHCVVRILVA